MRSRYKLGANRNSWQYQFRRPLPGTSWSVLPECYNTNKQGEIMRSDTDIEKTKKLLEYLGKHVLGPGRLYLTGGATALLHGIRGTTVDIDCKFDPEPKGVFEAIQNAKLDLDMNIELASPDHFIPPLPGWAERSQFVGKYGLLEVYHYDYYSQALAKIERGHNRDVRDVSAMAAKGLVKIERFMSYFEQIEADLIRYPGIDPKAFRKKIEAFLAEQDS